MSEQILVIALLLGALLSVAIGVPVVAAVCVVIAIFLVLT